MDLEAAMPTDKDDLTIPQNGPPDTEAVKHIQALMDRAVTFHRIETLETGRLARG